MSNHVHLLLRVNQEDIGSTIKHLAVMYAMYYNQKYSRSGHVFQDRFKSEPVNDMAYFVTLLRYLKRMSFDDLKELVEAPLDDDVQCLDLDETVKISVGDREIRQHLLESYGITDSIKVQEVDKEKRNEIIVSCLEIGAGMCQLSRLTGVTYGVINRVRGKMA